MGIRSAAIECCLDLAEPLGAQLAPVRELVASIPAPRCDHRQHEDPALAQQVLIPSRSGWTASEPAKGSQAALNPSPACGCKPCPNWY
jgi:hypothetical protein